MSDAAGASEAKNYGYVERGELDTPGTRFLRASGVSYEAFRVHKPSGVDIGGPKTTATAARFGIDEHNIIKTLVFYDNASKVPFVVLQHGDNLVNNKALAQQLGSNKVSPCTHETTIEVSGYIPGGVSPFGLKTKIQVYMESTILDCDKVIINGGSSECMILISPKDILAAYESPAAVVEGYRPIKFVKCAKPRAEVPPPSAPKGGGSQSDAIVSVSVPTASSATFVTPSKPLPPELIHDAAQRLLEEIEVLESFFPKNNFSKASESSLSGTAATIYQAFGLTDEKLELVLDKPQHIVALREAVVGAAKSSALTTLPELCFTHFLNCEVASGRQLRLNIRFFAPAGYPNKGIALRAAVTLLSTDLAGEIDVAGVESILDEEISKACASGVACIATSLNAIIQAITEESPIVCVKSRPAHASATMVATHEASLTANASASATAAAASTNEVPASMVTNKVQEANFALLPLPDAESLPKDEEGNVLSPWKYPLLGRVLLHGKPIPTSSALTRVPRDVPIDLIGKAKSNIRIGLVGLPNVGKSSLFNLISGLQVPAENYPFCTIKPNQAVVPVMDARYKALVEAFSPTSALPPVLRIFDIAGLVKGASDGKGLGNEFLHHISVVQVIFQVVRAFDDADVTHVEGSVDPVRDIEIINAELIAKDLERMYQRIERLANKGKVFMGLQQEKARREELAILLKAHEWLRTGHCLRHCVWNAAEHSYLSTLQLWTNKPVCYVVNMTALQFADEEQREKVLQPVRDWVDKNSPDSLVIPISVPFESVAQFAPKGSTPRQIAVLAKVQELYNKGTLEDDVTIKTLLGELPSGAVHAKTKSSEKQKDSHDGPREKKDKKEKKSKTENKSGKKLGSLLSTASAFDSYLDTDDDEPGLLASAAVSNLHTLRHDKHDKRDKRDKHDKHDKHDKPDKHNKHDKHDKQDKPDKHHDTVSTTSPETNESKVEAAPYAVITRAELDEAIAYFKQYIAKKTGESSTDDVDPEAVASHEHANEVSAELERTETKDSSKTHGGEGEDDDAPAANSRILMYREHSNLFNLIESGYKAAQLVHFFCCDRHLVRGYMVPAKCKAPSASARIHYLNEKLFLSCEVCSYEDWLKANKSMMTARANGWVRTCGRDYVVMDGDIIRFKFMPMSKLENSAK